jgi:hypothetical protein
MNVIYWGDRILAAVDSVIAVMVITFGSYDFVWGSGVSPKSKGETATGHKGNIGGRNVRY